MIHKCHLESQKLSSSLISTVNDNTWLVQSSTDRDKHYIVEKEKDECEANCGLKCQDCNVCVHMYCCNCNDALIDHTICKHIHLIASTNCFPVSKDSTKASTDHDDYDPLFVALHTDVCDVSDVLHVKNDIIDKLSSLSTQVQQCDSLSALSAVESLIKTADNAIKVNNSDSSQLHPLVNEPTNKSVSSKTISFHKKEKQATISKVGKAFTDTEE